MIYDIRKNREKIECFVKNTDSGPSDRQTLKSCEYPEVEDALYFLRTLVPYTHMSDYQDCSVKQDSVPSSQDTKYVSAIETNRLMLFGETVAVYCQNHTEHKNVVCGHNAEIQYVRAGGSHSDHWTLSG
jgi:hypothetical protein